MKGLIRITSALICLGLLVASSDAQGDDKVDVFSKVRQKDTAQSCRTFELGEPLESVMPVYPAEARAKRLGGAVRLEVVISENGNVIEITEAKGMEELSGAAKDAALKTVFSVSKCDGVPVGVKGVLTFNFVPIALTDIYIVPNKASDFSDVSMEMPFYEPVVVLTENYGLAFGYADGKFHGEAPITKGDFSHFLRLTLDLLQKRAELAQKIPREIDLYFPMNDQKLRSANEIQDLDASKPYGSSIGFLISKYDIALVDSDRRFQGKLPLSNNEVISYWATIFGRDAVPVNFGLIPDGDRIMSRGEFALFLQESLNVLTYKVLP